LSPSREELGSNWCKLELLKAMAGYPTMGNKEVRQSKVGELILVGGFVGTDVNIHGKRIGMCRIVAGTGEAMLVVDGQCSVRTCRTWV
jgi:hypothetical protein